MARLQGVFMAVCSGAGVDVVSEDSDVLGVLMFFEGMFNGVVS
jgi:hypothetical protein